MGKGEASEYEIRNRAAWIRLNRPESRNALSTELLGKSPEEAAQELVTLYLRTNPPAEYRF